MNYKIYLFFLTVFIVFSLAFKPFQGLESEPVFEDHFEYLTNDFFNHSFSVWKDGALLSINLEKDLRAAGNSAMRVDLQGPNSRTANRDASVFRILQLMERGWGGSSAARMWVKNPSDFPLVLSFNFKEEFSEYWATAGSQVFFLESENGDLLTQNAQYGNLPIPANYEGYLIIPFAGMTVPEWNTAHGDNRMDLRGVESFAIGISVDQHYPRHFFVDDFSVETGSYPYLAISGTEEIEVPSTGEHREQFSVSLINPEGELHDSADPTWQLAPGTDPGLFIEPDGWLVVPAGLVSQKASLIASYHDGKHTLIAERTVDLLNRSTTAVVGSLAGPETPVIQNPDLREKSPYEKFSENFEKWTYENRTLFVVLSVGAIVIVLVVLSYFQQRLR